MSLNGALEKNGNDRWQYGERELTCGDLVELNLGGQWVRGRIEHTPRHGYFFLLSVGDAQSIGVLYDRGGAVVLLHEGMPARTPARAR